SSQETVDSTESIDNSLPDLPPYLLIASSSLLNLFTRCPSCGDPSIHSLSFSQHGSAVVLKWKCNKCVKSSWPSQPLLCGRFYEGNAKIATAGHTTGLSLPRLAVFGDVLGLPLPAPRTEYDLLSKLVLPAVDIVYERHMRYVESVVRNVASRRGIDLSIDGRYSRPGFTALNATISFIHLTTNLILLVINMHKHMKGIDGISGRMEKEGVRRGLKILLAKLYKIRSVCTDNDAKIGKMLRDDFSVIKHLLDFWHLVKGINHDLRELAKKKQCPNIQYWRKKLINHAHYIHSKFGKSRKLGLQYWLSSLAHVTGRHRHFAKVPFLHGIAKCKHSRLGWSNAHLIRRDSEEFQLLKAVIMKPTFLAGFLRASPKKNTSPNECFNSIINIYAPKRIARSSKWYGELIKLAHLHYNTLALLDMLNLREERGNSSVKVIGREGETVKRKMATADHAWRREVWAEIPGVIEKRKLDLFMKKVGAPTDREYVLAMQEEEKDVEEAEGAEGAEEREEGDGGESDVSEELGEGLYGEEVDSDHNPVMDAIELSDAEDEESAEEEDEEKIALSSGSEWDEGEAGERWMALHQGRRGRGRGGRGGRGRGGTVVRHEVAAVQASVSSADPSGQQGLSDEPKGGTAKKRERRATAAAKKKGEEEMDEEDSSSD
ncbi:hypothetical protein PMAYCL1PPCAC_10267, partial [Pristionchus mayeri]